MVSKLVCGRCDDIFTFPSNMWHFIHYSINDCQLFTYNEKLFIPSFALLCLFSNVRISTQNDICFRVAKNMFTIS